MSDEITNRYLDYSLRGSLMQEIMDKYGEFLEENILKPMDKGAFEAFKITPAKEIENIIETQMMSKMVDTIRGRMNSLIQEGLLAREQLKQLEIEKEGEKWLM